MPRNAPSSAGYSALRAVSGRCLHRAAGVNRFAQYWCAAVREQAVAQLTGSVRLLVAKEVAGLMYTTTPTEGFVRGDRRQPEATWADDPHAGAPDPLARIGPAPVPRPEDLWPAEVDLILSALDTASARGAPGSRGDVSERRASCRTSYRVRAELKLFSDQAGGAPWVLYTRDIDPRGVGFITRHRLPLGYGGTVELFTPRGTKIRVPCTLLRCRQTVPGWFEGCLSFNREQWQFETE